MITEVLPQDPELEQIRAAFDKLRKRAVENKDIGENFYRAKCIVEFSKPTSIIRGGHYVTVEKMRVNTFETAAKRLCYTFGSHHGWGFDQIDFVNIKSISIPTYEEAIDNHKFKSLDNIRKAISLIHPNAWQSLKQELIDSPCSFEHYGSFLKLATPTKYKCTNTDGTEHVMYKSVFSDWVREQIKNAFDNKTDFSHETDRRTCRIRVECRLLPTGDFSAWYTKTLNDPKKPSKYSSGGRDFCYLLLNPNTAWFVERD